MINLSYLEEETRKADQELLDQYRKERDDIKHNRGIAKIMNSVEKRYAINSLTEAIEGFKGYLY